LDGGIMIVLMKTRCFRGSGISVATQLTG